MGVQNQFDILIIFDALHIYTYIYTHVYIYIYIYIYTLHIDFAYYSVYAFQDVPNSHWLVDEKRGVSSESPVTTGLFDDR